MSNIFKESDESVDTGGSIMSFKDCPNKCVNGYVIDIYHHRREKCEYCAEKRKQLARGNLKDNTSGVSYKDILCLPPSYKGVSFDVNTVIPESSKKLIEDASITVVTDTMQSLIEDISVGTLPEYSVLFNLGMKAYANGFIYSYLSKAYMQGVMVAPFLTALDICNYRNREEMGFNTSEDVWTYSKLLQLEACIVSIDAGATHNSIMAVKGFMQLRSLKGYATIIFTDAWNNDIKSMCADADNEESTNLARLVSVVYKEGYLKERRREDEKVKQTMASKNTVGMSTAEFNKLLGR